MQELIAGDLVGDFRSRSVSREMYCDPDVCLDLMVCPRMTCACRQTRSMECDYLQNEKNEVAVGQQDECRVGRGQSQCGRSQRVVLLSFIWLNALYFEDKYLSSQ